MPQGGAERRLATVLFLDIVGSTGIASDVGDRKWRELLSRFRRIVRRQLKRFDGREENFTGDGFLATFQEPERAVRAAVGIADAVHEIGMEVRCGVHTGECERIEGSLGGIAVHIASRVMSLAGTGEVLVTSTVKELVTGSGIGFEDFSAHELKGVPGTWQLLAVTSLDGEPVSKPLAAAEAAERIAAVEPPPFLRRRGRVLAGAGVIVALAVAIPLILLSGGGSSPAATGEKPTITMVRIDPQKNEVVKTLRDRYYSHHMPGSLYSQSGAMWQFTGDEIVRRDFRTGRPQLHFSVSSVHAGTLGFGSVWTAVPAGIGSSEIDRYDAVTGRLVHKTDVPNVMVISMSAGNGALWALGTDGTLVGIDPLTNKVVRRFSTPTVAPGVVVALDGYVWICDCEAGHVVQFDPRTDHEVRQLTLPEHGFLVAVDAEHGHTVWMLDPSGNTLTPIDPNSGKPGQPLGFGGQLGEAKIGFGSLWVAAANAVYRIDLTDNHHTTIEIPRDMTAGSIAIDPQTDSVWVGNCGCPRNG